MQRAQGEGGLRSERRREEADGSGSTVVMRALLAGAGHTQAGMALVLVPRRWVNFGLFAAALVLGGLVWGDCLKPPVEPVPQMPYPDGEQLKAPELLLCALRG